MDDIWSQYDKLLLIVANQKKYAEVSARLSQNKRVQRKLAQYAIEVLEGHLPALDWPL